MVKWRESRQSGNVQDRRGSRAVRAGGFGGGAGIVILVVYTLLGGNPMELLQVVGSGDGAPAGDAQADGVPPTDEMGAYLSAVLAMTEDVWGEIFARSGKAYREPTLVLFTESVQSACGFNTAATGPFYCPPDENLYLDTSFFEELARLGGAGDFAIAYVVGHEVGHHVQTLTGSADRARGLQQGSGSEEEKNRVQVLLELQADCYAGVWAYHANRRRRILEPGDVEEGLAAAAAIGDDRLQRRAGRTVSPESFTHGSSSERKRWLGEGLTTGEVAACDTFTGMATPSTVGGAPRRVTWKPGVAPLRLVASTRYPSGPVG